MTGLHTVADIHCTTCGTVLGWKYETAFEESQKYKEGKFIIEKAKVLKVSQVGASPRDCVRKDAGFCVAETKQAALVCCTHLQEGNW